VLGGGEKGGKFFLFDQSGKKKDKREREKKKREPAPTTLIKGREKIGARGGEVERRRMPAFRVQGGGKGKKSPPKSCGSVGGEKKLVREERESGRERASRIG